MYQARVLYNSLFDVYNTFDDNCPEPTSNARLGKTVSSDGTQQTNNNFIVYPNPAKDKICFTADNLGLTSYDVVIFDMQGKQVYLKNYNNAQGIKTINLNLPAGVYIIQLSNLATYDIYIKKLVIE